MPIKLSSLLLSLLIGVCCSLVSESMAQAIPKKTQSQKSSASLPQEIIVDAVLASVDGKPITLQDVTKHLKPPRQISFKDAAVDQEARQALEDLIFQKLVLAEAETRHLKVSDSELTNYLQEVSKRNNMSPEQFEQALRSQGLDLETYRDQIRFEILRSRLAGQIMQGASGVTTQEIEEYLSQHPELSKSGTKIKLRQIYVRKEGRTEEEVQTRLKEIKDKVEQGESFAAVANQFSDGPEAPDGGSLGVVAQEDLNPALFDAVFSLDEGKMSQAVAMPDGYRIFMVEKRYVEEGQKDERLYDEVRKTIQDQKVQSKMQAFFSTEIMKLHSVDKKI